MDVNAEQYINLYYYSKYLGLYFYPVPIFGQLTMAGRDKIQIVLCLSEFCLWPVIYLLSQLCIELTIVFELFFLLTISLNSSFLVSGNNVHVDFQDVKTSRKLEENGINVAWNTFLLNAISHWQFLIGIELDKINHGH